MTAKSVFPTNDGNKCDLHFLVESEINRSNENFYQLEERQVKSFESLNSSIMALTVQMKTFLAQQEFRDNENKEVKIMTLNNTNDINDLKSSLKSVHEHNKNVVDAISRMDATIGELSSEIRGINKTILGKEDVENVARMAISDEKSSSSDEWYKTLPAKVSATVAVLSFVLFYAIKIVTLLTGM